VDSDIDVSKRRELADRVADPAFLSAVCHDLRGPLGAIGTWLHVLGSGRADAATQQQALASMQRDVAAQTGLIEQLADLSAILAGTLKLSIEEMDLASALRESGWATPADLSSETLLVDPKRVRQILAILVPTTSVGASEGMARTVSVQHEAPGLLSIRGLASKGGGLVGLTVATALAELQGGHLTTSPVAEGIAFTLVLPTPTTPV